jgi:hypothetical protein
MIIITRQILKSPELARINHKRNESENLKNSDPSEALKQNYMKGAESVHEEK